ncbi:tetratricopeptide repeat protein [Rheinheimera marina]|uniref:Tetratricopeptide repeat protein n=1 Tax=Rheinheimera marina TaxID=1774958 RepID=A0ABV9JJ60_9GAMM
MMLTALIVEWAASGLMSYRLKYKRLLLCAVALCAGSVSASEHLSDHELFCQTQPQVPCEEFIRQHLAQAEPHSADWFKVKTYQLDYLFDKQQFKALFDETSALLQLQSLPQSIEVQVYFYHAKALIAFGRKNEALIFADKATQILEQIYQVFGDPLRMVELANLHYSMGQIAQAKRLLLLAESQFLRSKDPVFLFELNSNKALLSDIAGNYAESASFRKTALDAIAPLQHNGKNIVAYGNLGRTYQLLGDYPQAVYYYTESLKFMQPEQDAHNLALYQLKIAELYSQLNQLQPATEWLAKVEFAQLPVNRRNLYLQVESWCQQHTK